MTQGASGPDTSPACPGGSIVVEATPSGVAFRPSRKWASRTGWAGRAMLAFGVLSPVALVAVGLLFEPTGVTSVGAVLFLAVVGVIVSGSLVLGIAAVCRSAATPLLAEPTGRVSYGPQVLLEVGASPRLYIEERSGGGEGVSWTTYWVVASNRWGPVVKFPAPWFDEFNDRAVALWFARQLAAAIGAEVEDAEPGAAADGGGV